MGIKKLGVFCYFEQLLEGQQLIEYLQMEEYVSYRYLKQTKPISITATSESLLQPYPHKVRQTDKGIMAKNVSLYQHMIVDPHAKQNYVDWAINLRNTKKISIKQRGSVQTPAVYYKTTEQSKNKCMNKLNTSASLKASDFSQYFGKNASFASEDSLNFLVQLRNNSKSPEIKERFVNTPKKERNELPMLLKKGAIKKTRNLQKEDYESGFDGDFNFPSPKVKGRSTELLETLSPIGKRLHMSCLGWEVGLRRY